MLAPRWLAVLAPRWLAVLGANYPYRTLIERWNGRGWSVTASPNGSISPTAVDNVLSGVSAISSRDAFAVGWVQTGSSTFHVLILHWNGKSWSKA